MLSLRSLTLAFRFAAAQQRFAFFLFQLFPLAIARVRSACWLRSGLPCDCFAIALNALGVKSAPACLPPAGVPHDFSSPLLSGNILEVWRVIPPILCCGEKIEKKRGWRGEKIDFVPPACYNLGMAKVSYIDIDVGLQGLYYQGLKSADRFLYSSVRLNPRILSKKKIKGLTAKSLLPQISQLWSEFNSSQRGAWGSAALDMGLTGYQLFVKDQTLRIKNSFAGTAIPSTLHQSLVGNLHIEAPANELKIIQLHPRSYWISKKVVGKKGMYEPVEITEDFSLPLKISLNYYSDLVASGVNPSARFYARIWSSYQGVDRHTDLEINFDIQSILGSLFGDCYFGDSFFGDILNNNWYYAEATIDHVIGHLIGYDLQIHLYHLQGDFYFDNIKAEHSGQNWVRDTFCNDINQGFTRAFYQVPKHWVADIISEGADFQSIYKDF